jgi:hypothetical protein
VTVLAVGVLSTCKLAWLARSRTHELHGTWQLLSTILSTKTFLRFLLIVGGASLMTAADENWAKVGGGLLIVCGEFISRYLFFVSVVPTNMASGYLAQEAA